MAFFFLNQYLAQLFLLNLGIRVRQDAIEILSSGEFFFLETVHIHSVGKYEKNILKIEINVIAKNVHNMFRYVCDILVLLH